MGEKLCTAGAQGAIQGAAARARLPLALRAPFLAAAFLGLTFSSFSSSSSSSSASSGAGAAGAGLALALAASASEKRKKSGAG